MKTSLLILCLTGSMTVSAQTIPSSSVHLLPSKKTGNCQAVVVDDVPLAHTAQFLSLDRNGELVGKGSLPKQIKQVLDNISTALKEARSGLDQVIKINISITDPLLVPKVEYQMARYFKSRKKPAVSFVVSGLPRESALVAMDVVAVSAHPVNKNVVYFRSENLFSHSLASHVSILPPGSAVYVSGQALKGQIITATTNILKQLQGTLAHLGLNKDDVVQIRSFINPVTSAAAVEKEIAFFFAGRIIPPLVYVEWTSKDPAIEIELIAASPAVSPKPSEQLDIITPPGMTHSPLFSKVVRINYGKKLYISALYGKGNDAHAEVTDIFISLGDILKKAGSDFNHLVKGTYYVSNDKTSAKLNEIRPKFYDPKCPPAASKVMVKGVGMAGKGINVDIIAVVADDY
jgi:enamine deaminase RidA (YjgF/YER057c/UK114 family)